MAERVQTENGVLKTGKMMKASKIILGFFAAHIICLCVPQTVFSQTERLGIVQYTPPKGWNKTPKDNVVAFSNLNQTTGGFCIITVYGATLGAGNPQNDFTKEWNNLVVKPLQAEANPKTATQLADGWTVIAGGATVEFQGSKSLAFLTVFSGFGKIVSVLGVLNDQSSVTQLDTFISSIKLDKSAPTTNSPANQNNQPGKFGSMSSYTTPGGWNEQKFQDGVVFKPSDLPANEHLAMQIMPPLNFSGTLEQALAQSYDEAATMYKATKMYQSGGNYGKNAAQKSFNGWEYIRGKGGVQVENGTELGLELFVVKINNRFERVAILESRKYCGGVSRYYASDRMSYRNGIENLLFSLQFTDFNEPALKTGSTKGSGITGVWQGTIQSTGAAVGLNLQVFSPIFLTNGQVYFGSKFPTEGLDGLNTRIPPELYPRDWGTYTFSNGRGVMKMPYGDIPLRMEGDKLIISKNQRDWSFYQLDSVDGATFNGTYVLREVNGKIPTITFTSDGRFSDNGAMKEMYHQQIVCINPATTPGSGTYEVKDYSILFTYSDGRKIKLAFLGVGYAKSNPSPATLMMSFNEDKLIRQ
ncbi:MAG: hypothetical protein AABO57_28425 [Acidobacteriota bacterium]